MLLSVLNWMCIAFSSVIRVRLVPVDCSQSRARWHPCSRNHKHGSALLRDKLAQIVEQVIGMWVTQARKFDPPRCSIDLARDLPIGRNKQRLYPSMSR